MLSLGYQDAGIAVFLLNVEFNPQSANSCESLAEANERTDDRTNALKYYRQAVELLNRFPDRNKDYERSRAAALEKMRKLKSEQKK